MNEMIGHSPDPGGFEARITPLNGLSNSEPRPAPAVGAVQVARPQDAPRDIAEFG